MPAKKKEAAPKTEEAPDWGALASELDSVALGAGEATNDLRGYISTGCSVLDAEIGGGEILGGYPMGRITEFYGTEGVGKTTLATHAMVACQQGRGVLLEWVESKTDDGRLQILPSVKAEKLQPGLAILIDSEFKWPLDRAQRMGLDPQKLYRVRRFSKKGDDVPLSLEYCLEETEKLLTKVKERPYFQRPDVPVLIVWDSLAASPIEAELEGSGLQEGISAKARKVRAAMRRMTGLFAALNVTVLVVNQVYDRIGVPGFDTPGGRGVKFHSSHRMQLKKTGKLIISSVEKGITIAVKATKSSVCAPVHDTSIPIRFATGIDDDLALLEFFLARKKLLSNPIQSSGAWLKVQVPGIEKPISFQYGSWSKTLADHPELRTFLQQELLKNIRG